MVRTYKPKPGHRRYTKYDPELMKRAYREYTEGHDSISNIAKKYNISKSCLHGRIKLKRTKCMGGQTAFTSEREEHIIKYIHACAPWQYHLQNWDLRLLIKYYLDRRPVITKRKLDNNLPGQELVANFVKRHEDNISQKIIQSLTDDGSITTEVVLSYFHELKLLITDVDPGNIVCYNDILVADGNEENSKKKSEESQPNDIFSMLAASASGEMLQPYILYKEKQCYERVSKRSMTKQSHQARKRLNLNIFEDWFKTVILPFYEGKSGKKCLIGGYFSSRISLDLVQICKEHNIYFVFLPDKSDNLTHPLHSLSQLIFSAWSIIDHQRTMEGFEPTIVKARFYEIINNLANNAVEKVLQGFKKTGINPLNPVEVLKQLPDYNETTIEDVDEELEKDDGDVNLIIQVKKEVEWNDECSNDDFDEEITSMENKPAKEEQRDSNKVCGEKQTEDQMDQDLEVKLSPANSQLDMCEDATVFMPENIMENDDATPRSSRGRKLKPKQKAELSSDLEERNVIYYVPVLKQKHNPERLAKKKHKALHVKAVLKKEKTEVPNDVIEKDPLSSSQGGINLCTSETQDEELNVSGRCENAGCQTQTGLLEAILSSVRRQERLQERAALAAEAHAHALADIARLLERQAGNPAI